MIASVLYDRVYLKHFRKRIAPDIRLRRKFDERVVFFVQNPQHPLLHDHALKGEKEGYRAFSITGDIRIVYRLIDERTVLFLDIGTHNQVY